MQRRAIAAATTVFEAAGWTCRLDFSKRGGAQHIVVTSPAGMEKRLAIHGTPRDGDRMIQMVAARCRRIVRENQ